MSNNAKLNSSKVFSPDAETDGLYGKSFAISAIVYENEIEVDRFEGRIPDRLVFDGWVIENVLPKLADMPINYKSSKSLEEGFWAFWMKHKEGAECIAHCGSPVESGLYRRCIQRDLAARQFHGPYPLHEVGTLLQVKGYNAASVDEYLKLKELEVPFDGSAHHPTYDAMAAAIAWHELKK